VWLKQWSEVNGDSGRNPRVGFYIGIYFALGIGSAGLVVVQTLILWIFCSIEVSLRYGAWHPEPPCIRIQLTVKPGIQKVTRENGICDIPVAHELLRDVSLNSLTVANHLANRCPGPRLDVF